NVSDSQRGGRVGNHCTASTPSSNAGAASVAVNGLRKTPDMPASHIGRGYRAHLKESDEKRVGLRPIKLQLISTASVVVGVHIHDCGRINHSRTESAICKAAPHTTYSDAAHQVVDARLAICRLTRCDETGTMPCISPDSGSTSR